MKKRWTKVAAAVACLCLIGAPVEAQMGDYALRQEFTHWGSDSLDTPPGAHEDPRYARLFFLGPNDFADLNIGDTGECAQCFAWGRVDLDENREALFAKDLNEDRDGGDVWLWVRDHTERAAGTPLQVSRFKRSPGEEISGRFWLRDLDHDGLPELILAESRKETGQQRIEGGFRQEGCQDFRFFRLSGLEWREMQLENPLGVILQLRCEAD